MMSKFVSALLFGGLCLGLTADAAAAAPKRAQQQGENYTLRRGGGYSYNYGDTINTYGSSRSRFGGGREFRDPSQERQTENGPFDNGFFFDSATGPHGGSAPYMQ